MAKNTGWKRSKDRDPASTAVSLDRLFAIADRLRGVQLECRPASDVIAAFDGPDTLFYVDPPYVTSTRCVRWAGDDYVHPLDDDGHRALVQQLRGVRGQVLISGYRSELYDELLGDWLRVETPAVRLNGTGAIESLWLSPSAAGCLSELPMFSGGAA